MRVVIFNHPFTTFSFSFLASVRVLADWNPHHMEYVCLFLDFGRPRPPKRI